MSRLLPAASFHRVLTLTSEGILYGQSDNDMGVKSTAATPGTDAPKHMPQDCKLGLCDDDIINWVFPLDISLTFFRQDLAWEDVQINKHHRDAILFFQRAFGLEFAQGHGLNGALAIPGATLRPYTWNNTMNHMIYDVTPSGFSPTQKGASTYGGYIVKIEGPEVLAYGDYGGAVGKRLPMGSILIYGYFSLVNTPKVQWFHVRSMEPIRISANREWIFKSETIAFGTDVWGRLDGVALMEPLVGTVFGGETSGYHFSIRQVATFPGRL